MAEEKNDENILSVVNNCKNEDDHELPFVEKWKDIDPVDQIIKFTIESTNKKC